uniref:Chorionicgonadotropic hormone-like protein n=1 Tax=Stenotrophomonas maltophilia TaxID=40324 RepID=CGLH_STEMA|nr:RecName: Full=Chorionicgonadotropic hormone-like protein; Short=CG-like protein [Stenotrophomonas maltophilia]CAA54334.1 CG-like protein [Stenotrophomonas maltophilia]
MRPWVPVTGASPHAAVGPAWTTGRRCVGVVTTWWWSVSYVERQVQIIDSLYRAMDASAENGYTDAACRFRYLPEEDGSLGIDSSFFYTIGGVSVSALLNDYGDKGCADLVYDLHDVMYKDIRFGESIRSRMCPRGVNPVPSAPTAPPAGLAAFPSANRRTERCLVWIACVHRLSAVGEAGSLNEPEAARLANDPAEHSNRHVDALGRQQLVCAHVVAGVASDGFGVRAGEERTGARGRHSGSIKPLDNLVVETPIEAARSRHRCAGRPCPRRHRRPCNASKSHRPMRMQQRDRGWTVWQKDFSMLTPLSAGFQHRVLAQQLVARRGRMQPSVVQIGVGRIRADVAGRVAGQDALGRIGRILPNAVARLSIAVRFLRAQSINHSIQSKRDRRSWNGCSKGQRRRGFISIDKKPGPKNKLALMFIREPDRFISIDRNPARRTSWL